MRVPIKIYNLFAKKISLRKKKAKQVSIRTGVPTELALDFSDNAFLEEVFKASVNQRVSLTDATNVDEDYSKSLGTKILELINIQESFKSINEIKILLNDVVQMVDLEDDVLLSSLFDQLDILEEAIFKAEYKNILSDSLSLSELISIIVNFDINQQLADTVTLDDLDFKVKIDNFVSFLDVLSVADNLTKVENFITRILQEDINLEEAFNTSNSLNLTYNEDLNLEEEVNTYAELKNIISSLVAVSEMFINNVSLNTLFTESLTTSESFSSSTILSPQKINLLSPTENESVLGFTNFTWESDSVANRYDIQVATNSSFSALVVNVTNLTTTSYTNTSQLSVNTYYWRVRGRNSISGVIGPWSDTRVFGVVALQAPQIVFPANNQSTDIPTTIVWNTASLALSYDLQISTNSAFNTFFEVNTNTTNTSFVFSAMVINTPYYFRLRSVNGSLVSAWTATRAFFKIPIVLNDSTSVSENFTSQVVTPNTDDIYLYQLLSDDPTTKTLINWVDEAGTPDGTTQTLTYYPEGNPSSITTLNVTGTVVPNTSNSAFRYSAKISGLTANTTYKCKVTKSGFISNEYTFKTFKTTLGSDSFRVAVLSDIHIDRTTGGSMNSAARMQHVRSQNPDVLFLMGDIVSQSYNLNTTNSQLYLTFFKEHINTYLNTSRVMIPMVNIPGNHDLGERNPATTNVSATSGYFQLFWNTFKEYNSNNNYGAIKFGNYLKLVGLDLFSANPTTNANFINGLANDTEYVIPFSHFPILPSTTRESYDADYFNPVIQGLAPALNSNNKIKAYFTGHMHTRFNSKGWKVVNTSPAPANSLSLGSNNYIVEDTSATRKKEYGQGYRNNRPLATVTTGGNTFGNTAWYVNEVESSENIGTFYVVEIKAANEKFDVITYNSTSSGVQSVRTDNLIGGEEFVQFSETITVSDNIEQEETITELEPLYLAIDDSIWDI
jgi:predicted MPP superfamily phosphohydrolase